LVQEKVFVVDKKIVEKEKEIEEEKGKELANLKPEEDKKSESSLASRESDPEDKEAMESDEEGSKLQDPQECFKILKTFTTRIFGTATTFDHNIETLIDYSRCKKNSIIVPLTPLTLENMKSEGSVTWNIFRKKDLRDFSNIIMEYYAELEPLTQHLEKCRMPEVFVILTSDRISFEEMKKHFESDEKEGLELRFKRKLIPKLSSFICYMPSFDIPDQIESLGDELDNIVRMEDYNDDDTNE
jgi:hypothetical protein